MSALLPTAAANDVMRGITEYLATTVGLAEKQTADAFAEFLQHQSLFRGPYVRTRMPFLPAPTGEPTLQWLPGWFHPYVHQAQAFHRLRSAAWDASTGTWQEREPEPTLVVTGTGSGKTEAFLYPLLDHCQRRRRAGERGMKALILYPMNALANDQAARLARLISGDPRLRGVSAGLYTGEHFEGSAEVTEDSLITSRSLMRDTPPDILLTNYKMLDQLLMRTEDQRLWSLSKDSLQYVVLDEAHTYDGAQGTDVAMLLRRLGLKLKTLRGEDPADDPRPLGKMTPVATSATIGNEDAPAPLLEFIHAVFGVRLAPEAIVRESRLSVHNWSNLASNAAATNGAQARDAEGASGKQAILEFHQRFSWAQVRRPVEALVRSIEQQAAAQPANFENIVRNEFADFFAKLLDSQTIIDAFFDVATPTSGGSATRSPEEILRQDSTNPWILQLLRCSQTPQTLPTLAGDFFGIGEAEDPTAIAFISHMVAWLSAQRAELAKAGHLGRRYPTIDVHLWVRELSRINRTLSEEATFEWADDAPNAATSPDSAPKLPAIYCRNCSRAGWMITLLPATRTPEWDAARIRQESISREGRAHTRPLIYAPEAHAMHPASDGGAGRGHSHGAPTRLRSKDAIGQCYWIDPYKAEFTRDDLTQGPPQEGCVPVLTYLDQHAGDHAADQTCPACGASDSIRFIGSAVSTLLSVTVSNLFGLPGVDAREKKALVFTDSVQDAAHRAGFVEARSHAFTLRTGITAAIHSALRRSGTTPGHARGTAKGTHAPELLPLSTISRTIVEDATTASERFQLLPPDLNRAEWAPHFYLDPGPKAGNARQRREAAHLMARRLSFDVGLEFGRRGELGRTLLLTGVACAEVDANDALLLSLGRQALATQPELAFYADAAGPRSAGRGGDEEAAQRIITWVRGMLERIRSRGGIAHPWLEAYRAKDGNLWWLNRQQPAGVELPKFAPNTGPRFPRVGPKLATNSRWITGTDQVASPSSWYARWTVRALQFSASEAVARSCSSLLTGLGHAGVLDTVATESGGITYGIPQDRVLVGMNEHANALHCPICHTITPAGPHSLHQLNNAPCFNLECEGRLQPYEIADNYYRTMYTSTIRKSIVAREHTSLLQPERRAELERAFRSNDPNANPGAVNVLVATPTLEMGIDIGDLSAVLLSSMPRSVANYLQRVGRAGRLTGNALNIAIVRGRGEHLPKMHNPLSVIDGEVTPPSVYLNAREIVRRQAFAAIMDAYALATEHRGAQLGQAQQVFSPSEPLQGQAAADAACHLERALQGMGASQRSQAVEGFLQGFGELLDATVAQWVRDFDYLNAVRAAATTWAQRKAELGRKIGEVTRSLEQLHQAAEAAAASSEDKTAEQLARSTTALLHKELRELQGEPWIAALERAGLLPNYTLLDDSVELKVTTIHRKKDSTVEFRDGSSYRRGARIALQELAPGSKFYAEGMTINIDAVDVGRNGEKVVSWRLCPSCSYAAEALPAQEGQPCPACGDPSFGGSEQTIKVLPLESVSAQVRLDQDIIDGSHEQRQQQRFSTHVTCSWRPEDEADLWSVEASGFAVLTLDEVLLRWLNLGKGPGAERTLSGGLRKTPLFTVCRGCGQVDNEAQGNRPQDHRGWCQYRKSDTQHNITMALGRTLSTQAAVLYLPPAIQHLEPMGIPSLLAALRLGFREVFGGNPQNLDIQVLQVPLPERRGQADGLGGAAGAGLADDELAGAGALGAEGLGAEALGRAGKARTVTALVLHDTVPGGTGYLAGFRKPERVWDLLRKAYDVVSGCECQHDARLCCTDCLLPYAPSGQLPSTSREVAALALRLLLMDPEAAKAEPHGLPSFTEAALGKNLAKLAQRNVFELTTKQLISRAMQAHGWEVTSVPNGSEVDVVFRKPGEHLRWTLSPQVRLQAAGVSTLPDFVLESNAGANKPRFAIYCDSKQFHASTAHPRVHEDARIRAALRPERYIPWAITWRDVEQLTRPEGAERSDAEDYAWWVPEAELCHKLFAKPNVDGSTTMLQRLTANPIDLLIDVVNHPDDPWEHFANVATVCCGISRRPQPVEPDSNTYFFENNHIRFSAHNLVGVLGHGLEPGRVTGSMNLTVAPEEGEQFQASWRRWLVASNWLGLRAEPWEITTSAPEHSELADILDLPTVDAGRPGTSGAERPTPPGAASHEVASAAPASQPNAASPTDSTAGEAAEHAPVPNAQWQRIIDEAISDVERSTAHTLAAHNIPLPVQGEEFDGEVADLAWPKQRLIVSTDPDAEFDALASKGWTIVQAEDLDALPGAVELILHTLNEMEQ